MGFGFGVIPGEGGSRAGRSGRFRLRRWVPQAVCLAVALGVFIGLAATNPDVDPGNLRAIPTVPLWISVFTGHLWRRAQPGPDGLAVLLLRRRVRRVVWRAALVLVFAAFALLWTAGFRHWTASLADDAGNYPAADADAGHYAFFAGLWWRPLPVAGFLVLVRPALFRLAPAPVRDAFGVPGRNSSVRKRLRNRSGATRCTFHSGAQCRAPHGTASPGRPPTPRPQNNPQ